MFTLTIETRDHGSHGATLIDRRDYASAEEAARATGYDLGYFRVVVPNRLYWMDQTHGPYLRYARIEAQVEPTVP